MEVKQEQSITVHHKEAQNSRFHQQHAVNAVNQQPFPRLARGYCTHCGVLLQFKLQNISEPAVKVQCPKCSTISAFSVTPLHMAQSTPQNGHPPQTNQVQYSVHQQYQSKQLQIGQNSIEQMGLENHFNQQQQQQYNQQNYQQNGSSHVQNHQINHMNHPFPVSQQQQPTIQFQGQIQVQQQALPQPVVQQQVMQQITPQITQQATSPQQGQPASQPQPSSPQQASVTSLVANHKVEELKEKCRKLGLRVGGTKTELATRIMQKLSQQATTGSPPQQPLTTSPQMQQHATTSPSSSPSTPNIPSPTIPTNIQAPQSAPAPAIPSDAETAAPVSPLKRSPPDGLPLANGNHKKIKSEAPQETWLSLVETQDPSESYVPRVFHSAVVYGGGMYVYGGQRAPGGLEDIAAPNVGVFDFSSGSWSSLNCVGTPPPHRKEHSAVVYNDHMYVFGGEGKTRVLNDLYSLSLKPGDQHEWKLITTEEGPIPPPRAAHTAVVIGNSMLVFGGYDAQSSFGQSEGLQCHCEFEGEWGCVCQLSMNQAFADLWEFSFETKTWRKEARSGEWPCPRHSHMAFAHDNAMYIVGGHKMTWPELFEGPFEDLWRWSLDKKAWEQVHTKGEFPRDMFRGNSAFDASCQCLFVFNSENVGEKSIHRLNLNNQVWEKFSKMMEWDWRSELGRFQFHGMSVVLLEGKAVMHGNFAEVEDIAPEQIEKHLVVFRLDKF